MPRNGYATLYRAESLCSTSSMPVGEFWLLVITMTASALLPSFTLLEVRWVNDRIRAKTVNRPSNCGRPPPLRS